MRIWRKLSEHIPGKGQSLVETALFLPILIFILAGLVEVGNLLVTQNRITTSSRISAGFGAANFNPSNWSSTAGAMGITALNTVTETLDLDRDLWDIWAIRVKTNTRGTDIPTFDDLHVYGNNQVVSNAQWATLEGNIKTDILEALQSECDPLYDKDNKNNNIPGTERWPCAGDMTAVVSVPFYNMDTILGLPVWQWLGLKSVEGLTVMRVGELPKFGGCPILPITIRREQWSVYPTNWDQPNQDLDQPLTKLWGNDYDGWFDPLVPYGGPYGDDPVRTFPAPGDLDYPDGKDGYPIPVYNMITDTVTTTVKTTTFTGNVPGIPLDLAKPDSNYVYWAREVGGAGQFGWLQWRDWEGSTGFLSGSLDSSFDEDGPGNFLDPVVGYPNGNMDQAGPCSDGTANPFVDCSKPAVDPPCDSDPYACGNGDNWLDIGEWVAADEGNVASPAQITNHLDTYINTSLPVFLIIYDYNNYDTESQTGENVNYHVWDFAKVQLLGYKLTASEKWILFEFLDWGYDCQQPIS